MVLKAIDNKDDGTFVIRVMFLAEAAAEIQQLLEELGKSYREQREKVRVRSAASLQLQKI